MAIKKKPAKKAVKKPVGKKKPAKKAVKKPVGKKKPAKKAVKKKAPAKVKKTSLLDRIASHREELEKAKSKAIKQGDKFFREAVKSIFKKFPRLESFSWQEYTPHWNDGDECTFSVYFESLTVNQENNPESLWELQSLHELLSNKDKEKARIERELSGLKDGDWNIPHLKSQLKDIAERDPADVAEKYNMKKTIIDLLEGISTEAYQVMFGEGTVTVRRDGVSVDECEHD